MRTRTKDYHDYVIQDSQFIGAFEQMYQDCPDPWHQLQMTSHAYPLLLDELGRRRWSRILDVGCGLGAFTMEVHRAARCSVIGMDISPTALQQARARVVGQPITFVAADATALPLAPGSIDGAIVSELLWYVLPAIKTVMRELAAVLKPEGELWIVQQFYPPEQQRYGKETMQRPEDCIGFVQQAGLSIIRTIELDRQTHHKLVLFARKG